MKKIFYPILIIIAVCLILFCRPTCGISIAAKKYITFKGTAKGGTLILGDGGTPSFVRYYAINTVAGESAESVVKRLAETMVSSDTLIIKFSSSRPANEIASDIASGNTLIIPGSANWCIAGTETGLGIPETPMFLSCSYDEITNKLKVNWENPASISNNDIISIRWRYRNSVGEEMGGSELIPGVSTSYMIDRTTDIEGRLIYVWLQVLRYDTPAEVLLDRGISIETSFIPSNITAILVTNDGYCQQEKEGIPFTNGVAPNWTVWSTAEKVDTTTFEQYERTNEMRFDSSGQQSMLENKPFYQIINAPLEGGSHGIYRKFLGLTPGHTYRLTACVSTLEMESAGDDWAFSIHAVPSGSNGNGLSAQQMAGTATLPNGQQGLKAAQTVSYGPGRTTEDDFDLAITGETKLEDGQVSSDIILPQDANEITVWLRFNCGDPKGKVGFSGVKLEDITAIQSQ